MDDESITRLYDGSYTIACIDIYSRAHNESRDAQSFAIACVNTFTLAGMTFWGYCRFCSVRDSYEPHKLMAWYTNHKAETQQAHESLRRGRKKQGQGAPLDAAKGVVEDADDYRQYDSEPDST